MDALLPWDDAPLWYQQSMNDTLSGKRARVHLHQLHITPFKPKPCRNRRMEKTRDYRRSAWRRQPEPTTRDHKETH